MNYDHGNLWQGEYQGYQMQYALPPNQLSH